MKRRQLWTWLVLAVWLIGIVGIVRSADMWQLAWMWLAGAVVLWTVLGGVGLMLLRRSQRRRMRAIRKGKQIRVEGERLAYEEEGRILWVLRKDISRIREWPRHGIVIDTHEQKGVLTIPLDSENYHELRVALMLWDPNILESAHLRVVK